MPDTSTRTQILTRLGQRMGDGVTGTATAWTTTTMTDDSTTSPFSTFDNLAIWRGAYLYNAATAVLTERRVTAYDATTMKLTTSLPNWTGISATDAYEVHGLMSRAGKVEALNRALARHCFFKLRQPLTLVLDGDMETSGTAKYAAVGTTTLSKTAASLLGSQSLRSVNTAANSGASLATALPVNAGDPYYLEALVKPGAGTVSLIAYDVTNSANIASTTMDGSKNAGWSLLWVDFTVPATSRSLQVRLLSDGATDTHDWDDVILLHTWNTSYDLPDWLDGWHRMDGVWVRTPARDQDVRKWDFRPVAGAGKPYFYPANTSTGLVGSIQVPRGFQGQPVYVTGLKNYATLTTDTATTLCPSEWIEAATAVEILQILMNSRRAVDQDAVRADIQFWAGQYRSAYRKFAPTITQRNMMYGKR